MKVPEELVETALEASWPNVCEGVRRRAIRDEIEAALEAVLPKVRERLEADDAIVASAKHWTGDITSKAVVDQLRRGMQAAFDHAFPEESSEARIDAAEGQGRR